MPIKEGEHIKSVQELVERAQIQLVLNDRLIWENGYSEGRFHSVEERKKQQCLEASWIISRGLDTVMNCKDMQLLNQEIETVATTVRSQRSFECESIEPILWAGSFVKKLTPVGKFMQSDFHALLIGQSKDHLFQTGKLRNEDQIINQRDIFMLWYWRSKTEQKFGTSKGMSVLDTISSIFSQQEVMCAKEIRRVEGDFAIRGIPFYSLTPKEKYMIGNCVKWRYHALEWILNEESWYDTSVDT